jgi:hypothetical protein
MPEENGVRTLRYLKIIDKSIKTSNRFPGSADGYDVDGVFGYPCDFDGSGKYALYDENNIPDEDMSMFFAGVAPNPTSGLIDIKLETGSAVSQYTIIVSDLMGRTLVNDGLTAGNNSFVNHVMNLSHLPSGIYMVSIDNGTYRTVEKLIKN